MSLDVYLYAVRRVNIYDANVTHNLNDMADAAGIYKHLWRPDELGIKTARELIVPLETGLRWLRENPEQARMHNPENGWGSYEGLIKFVESYLAACVENPDAEIAVSR